MNRLTKSSGFAAYSHKQQATRRCTTNTVCVVLKVFAHSIHLSDEELELMASTGSQITHCPSANLFLGSGLFDFARAKAAGVQTALGSDVGAGTSLCLLDVLRDFYSVQMTQGHRIDVGEMLYLATQAGANLGSRR